MRFSGSFVFDRIQMSRQHQTAPFLKFPPPHRFCTFPHRGELINRGNLPLAPAPLEASDNLGLKAHDSFVLVKYNHRGPDDVV